MEGAEDDKGVVSMKTKVRFVTRKTNYSITTLINELRDSIAEYDRTQDQATLARKLSDIFTEGKFSGNTRLYQLMYELNNASRRYHNEDVAAVANIINTLVEKCDGDLLASALSKIPTGGSRWFIRANGWFYLMSALEEASDNYNQENAIKIADVIKKLIVKCDPVNLAKGLFGEPDDFFTGWKELVSAVYPEYYERSAAKSVFFQILNQLNKLDCAQITDRWKEMIVENKCLLSPFLRQYLKNKAQTTPIATFEKMCNGQKLLGVLIDHHRWFGTGKTETRKWVDRLIKQKKIKTASPAASPVLSDAQTFNEPSPPSYEQALQIIAKKRQAKIGVLNAAEALFKLPCDTKLHALNAAKSEAKKAGYDFEADDSVREIRENIRQKIERLETVIPKNIVAPIRFFASNVAAKAAQHRSLQQIQEAERQAESARLLAQVCVPTGSLPKRSPEQIQEAETQEETARLLAQVRVPTGFLVKREEQGNNEVKMIG